MEELQSLQAKHTEEMREARESATASLDRERSAHNREMEKLRRRMARNKATQEADSSAAGLGDSGSMRDPLRARVNAAQRVRCNCHQTVVGLFVQASPNPRK